MLLVWSVGKGVPLSNDTPHPGRVTPHATGWRTTAKNQKPCPQFTSLLRGFHPPRGPQFTSLLRGFPPPWALAPHWLVTPWKAGRELTVFLRFITAVAASEGKKGSKEQIFLENTEEGLLMKVKEESEKVGLKLSIQKTKIMASGPITSWQMDGKQWKQWQTLFS